MTTIRQQGAAGIGARFRNVVLLLVVGTLARFKRYGVVD